MTAEARRSHLWLGKVVHRRSSPRTYGLEHDVWYLGLDVDELSHVFDLTGLLRRNRRAVVSFRDGDHLEPPATDVPADFRAYLRREGLEPEGWRIELIANARVLGYAFNPASVWLCHDAATLRAVVVEVHNTFGERHLYTLLPERPGAAAFSASMDKAFFVSPFIGPDGRYRVTVRESGEMLSIGIAEREDGKLLLATSLVLRRLPLTRRNLVWLLLRYPLVTHKTTSLIYWHALRLWLRGMRLHHFEPKATYGQGHHAAATLTRSDVNGGPVR